MDVTFTEEQESLKQRAVHFMDKYAPKEKVREWHEKWEYPYEVFDKWAQEGWLAMPFPEKYGGKNIPAVDMMLMAEGFALRGYEVASLYSQTVFTAMNIIRLGTEAQKDYYIPRTIKGDVRYGVGFTERTAGSDASNIRTTAVRDGDNFVINGEKIFCTVSHAKNCVIQLAARTDPTADKHQGISLILVPNDTPGVAIERINTVGRHIASTNRVTLSNAKVPVSNLLGPLHEGWKAILGHHGTARVFIGAAVMGAAQTVIDEVAAYAKQRVQFDQPISRFQAVAHKLVDMQTAVEAGRWLVYRTASLIDKDIRCIKEVCMTKLYCCETYANITNAAMQVMGGYGYIVENDISRYWLEARILTVAGGSSEIQRNVIARQMRL